MKPSPRTCCCAGGCPMLDMAAFRAEEKKSALIGAGCAGAAGAGSEESAGASRLPEAQRGTEPDNPATCR